MIKKAVCIVVVALTILSSSATGQIVEEIVAVVNNDIITLSEYKNQYESMAQSLRTVYQGEEYEKQLALLKTDLLNMMINDLLLMQTAKEKNINVGEQVKMTIQGIKKENNIESDDELKRELQRQGLDYNQWIKQLEENLLKQAVVYTEIEKNLVLDDTEIVGYYKLHLSEFTEPEEYRIRAIYLSDEKKTKTELGEQKEEINRKLKEGETFNLLAKQFSDGPAKEAEGDLGFFKKGELDKTLEQAVSSLKAGEMSEWLETKNGWYLLKLEEKKDSRLRTFEESRKEIEENLYSQKRQKLSEEYIKNIREKSYVKILLPNPLNL